MSCGGRRKPPDRSLRSPLVVAIRPRCKAFRPEREVLRALVPWCEEPEPRLGTTQIVSRGEICAPTEREVVHRVEPNMPVPAREANVTGYVVTLVRVDEGGSV